MTAVRTNNTSHLELIRRYSNLFWYVSEEDKANLSIDAIVEAILNYGDLEAVRNLIKVAGISNVAENFFRQNKNKRVNYFPQVANFFTLYFKRHAPGSTY
jgi:hypothetical protein